MRYSNKLTEYRDNIKALKEIDSLEAVILYDEACRDIASNYIQAGLKSKVG